LHFAHSETSHVVSSLVLFMQWAPMRPASHLLRNAFPKAITLLVSASANFHETSANSLNRSPIEAGNNQMLFPSIGACNRNNF
jgi:hypothetical protein